MQNQFKSLFRNSVIYSIGTISSKLMGFVLIPLYTDLFTLSEFGVIGLLEVATTLITAFAGMALYSGFFRWYYDKETAGKENSLFFTILIFQIFVAFIVYLFIFYFKDYLTVRYLSDIKYNSVFNLMAISAMIQIVILLPTTLARLQEKPWLFTISSVSQLFVSLIVTIYFIVYKNSGIIGIYYGQISGAFVVFLILLRYTIKNIRFKFEWKLLKSILIYCFPLMFSGLALTFLNITDRLSLNFFSTTADVGLYSYGFKIANTLYVIVVTSINFAIQPIMFKMMNEENNKDFFSKLLTYYVLVVMLLGFLIMIYGKEIARLFSFNPEYFGAWVVIPFIIYSIVFGVIKDMMATTGLSFTKKTKIIASLTILSALLNILFNAILVPYLFGVGSAISKLLSMIIYAVLIFIASQKYFPIKYQYYKLALIIILPVLLYLISLSFNDFSLIPRLILKFALICLYPLSLYFLKIFSNHEIEFIKDVIKRWKNPSNLNTNLKKLFNK